MWSWTWSERCIVVNMISTVGTENTYRKTSSRSPIVKMTIFLCENSTFGPRWTGVGVRNGPFDGDLRFHFSISFSLKMVSFSSCISLKYVSLLKLEKEFSCRSFLRRRCSMEMWCPDDMKRDSWDWVGPPTLESARSNSPLWCGGSSPVTTEPRQSVLLLLLVSGVWWCLVLALVLVLVLGWVLALVSSLWLLVVVSCCLLLVGCVAVWLFGCVVVWLCGCVVVWLCGCVVVWLCGCVAVWLCGCVVVCCWLVVGCLVVWLFDVVCLVGWCVLCVGCVSVCVSECVCVCVCLFVRSFVRLFVRLFVDCFLLLVMCCRLFGCLVVRLFDCLLLLVTLTRHAEACAKYTQETQLKASTARGDRKTSCRGFHTPFFVRGGCRKPHKNRALRMLPFAEQGKRSLVLLGTGCNHCTRSSATLSAHCFCQRAPQRQHHLISPVSFLSPGSAGCASAADPLLGQPSFVAVVPW